MKQVEIYILSGFLGAGKTTLLQKALEEEQRNGRTAAVVMNEIGQASVDSDAVPNGTPLKELLNGCVCCTLSNKLEVQLSELLNAVRFRCHLYRNDGSSPIQLRCWIPVYHHCWRKR